MKYSPPIQRKKLYLLCIPLFVFSAVTFWLAGFLPYAGILQAAGGVALTAFLFLNIRFALSRYRYEIDGSSLMVFRKQGRREEKLCDVELSAALSLMDRQSFRREKPTYELCYNFCQNFAADDRSYFLFTFNDREKKRALLILEADEEMKKILAFYSKQKQ